MQNSSQSSEQLAERQHARWMPLAIFALGILFLGIDLWAANALLPVTAHHRAKFLFDVIALLTLTTVAYLASNRIYRLFASREVALRDLEERYTRLCQCVSQVILTFQLDADGHPGMLHVINDAACRYGYTNDELLSLTLRDIIPLERSGDIDTLLHDLAGRSQAQLDTLLLTRDKRQIPVSMHATLLENTITVILHDISDAKHIEDSLREARSTIRALMKASPMAMMALDRAGTVREWNRAAEAIFDWKEYEVFGGPPPFVNEINREAFTAYCASALGNETRETLVLVCENKDGRAMRILLSAIPATDSEGEFTGLTVLITDASQQFELESQVATLRRALSLSSKGKHAVFRATTEKDMLHNTLDTIMEHGGYAQAWIGFTEDDRLRTVRPSAWGGDVSEGVEYIEIPTVAGARTNDPVALAVRQGTPAITRHLLTRPVMPAWLVSAMDQGFDAVIALPLLSNWHAFGIMVVYSRWSDSFTETEVEALTELADTLAFGIEAMRSHEKRLQANQELLSAARQWRMTFDAISGPILAVDHTGTIARCNLAATRLFNMSFDQLLGKTLCTLVHGDEHQDACLMDIARERCERTSGQLSLHGRCYAVTVEPLLDDMGTFAGALHIMTDVTDHKLADEESKRHYSRLQNIIDETIMTIAKISEMRDPYTSGHDERVSELACAIAREMQLSPERLEGLRVAGMLHDIGKLYVPAEILSKSGKLTDAEFAVTKQHPQAGYEILSSIDFPWPVADMIRQHHERLDGSGYPGNLAGDEILLEARILAVADVVESMASHRPYRPARGVDEALQEIVSGAGLKYDPDVVVACVRVIREQGFVLQPLSPIR